MNTSGAMLAAVLRHFYSSLPEEARFSKTRHLLCEVADEVACLVRPLDADVAAFNRKFGHPAPQAAVLYSQEVLDFRVALAREELREVEAAAAVRDLPKFVHESVDLAYVAIGNLVACGVPLAPVWEAVHAANMGKERNLDGGKPLKPEGWRAADVTKIVGTWEDARWRFN